MSVREPLPILAPSLDSCALTGQRREVAWFLVCGDILLRETRPDLYDERFFDGRRAPTGEPQESADLSPDGSVWSDCKGTLPVKRAPGLAFRATLPATCATTILRVSCALSTVVVCDNCGEEGAHGAGETDMCVRDDSTFPKINNPVTRSLECGLASVPQAGTGHESDGLAFLGESTATCTEDHEAKSRVIASTTQTCHLDGYGYGLAVHKLRHDDRVAVFCQHPRSNKKLDTPDGTNSTVGGTVGCATDPELASGDNFRALCVC